MNSSSKFRHLDADFWTLPSSRISDGFHGLGAGFWTWIVVVWVGVSPRLGRWLGFGYVLRPQNEGRESRMGSWEWPVFEGG